MLSISHDQAYERAYHFKKHQRKLEEIKKKSNTLDNQLSSSFHSIAKGMGTEGFGGQKK